MYKTLENRAGQFGLQSGLATNQALTGGTLGAARLRTPGEEAAQLESHLQSMRDTLQDYQTLLDNLWEARNLLKLDWTFSERPNQWAASPVDHIHEVYKAVTIKIKEQQEAIESITARLPKQVAA